MKELNTEERFILMLLHETNDQPLEIDTLRDIYVEHFLKYEETRSRLLKKRISTDGGMTSELNSELMNHITILKHHRALSDLGSLTFVLCAENKDAIVAILAEPSEA